MVSAFQELQVWLDWLVLAHSQESGRDIELADRPCCMDIDLADQPYCKGIDLAGPKR